MTEPSNFRLKDGKTITIDGKDVQRIRILNDIVWEKTKGTSLTLTGTPSSVTSGKVFNLTAVIADSNGTPMNADINFTGNGISGTKTITANNGIATLQNISTTNIGSNTYTATFLKTDFYEGASATTTVTVKKETPVLTIVGEKTVYDTWKIGVKLTAADGKKALTKQTIKLTINGKTHNITTNSKGIASWTVSGIKEGTYSAKYEYAGNNVYSSKSLTQSYKILDDKTKTLEFSKVVSLGTKSTSNHTQAWKKNSNTSYQCYETGKTCYATSDTIGTAVGTFKKPDLLKIAYKKDDVNKITSATLTFNSQSVEACKGSYLAGLFSSAPTIKLSTNGGSSFAEGTGAKAFSTKKSGSYSYSTHDVLKQTIKWKEKTVTSNPIISIQYPANSGVEEGCIKISSLSLQVTYIPTQSTSFS